jgi:citrate lyase subunit beta / citryl-CoA lyase
MRSLLFVPADGGPKLDKAMASGADAVILDLEDSIMPERKAQARAAALEFLKATQSKTQRPRLLVRINGLETGMTDADLDVIVAGMPDAVLFPKAEGGATGTHLDCRKDRSRFWRKQWSRPRACLPPAPTGAPAHG